MSRSCFIAAILTIAASLAWAEAGDWPSGEASRPSRAASRLGFRLDIATGGSFAPSYGADQDPLAAGEYSFGLGTELLWGRWIPVRSRLDFYWVGASEWSEDLFRYRGFHGARWACETGVRLPLGGLELDLLAGGALSAARYADLSIATAYPSVVGEARLLVPIAIRKLPGFAAEASLPLEYMWRGTARTFSAGLELGAAIALGRSAQ